MPGRPKFEPDPFHISNLILSLVPIHWTKNPKPILNEMGLDRLPMVWVGLIMIEVVFILITLGQLGLHPPYFWQLLLYLYQYLNSKSIQRGVISEPSWWWCVSSTSGMTPLQSVLRWGSGSSILTWSPRSSQNLLVIFPTWWAPSQPLPQMRYHVARKLSQ